MKEIKRARKTFWFSMFLLLALTLFGCGANEGILKSGKETPAPSNVERGKTPIANDIEAMQTAGFTFIYVLRRRDGGVIDAGDRSVIKLNTGDVNRRVAADDDKAFILGSNFQIPAKNLAALYDRFAVEDHSEAPAPAVNTNREANTNTKK